jgi:hypothetical protein
MPRHLKTAWVNFPGRPVPEISGKNGQILLVVKHSWLSTIIPIVKWKFWIVESARDVPYGDINLQEFMYFLPTILPCSGRYSGQRVHKFLQIYIPICIWYISRWFNNSSCLPGNVHPDSVAKILLRGFQNCMGWLSRASGSGDIRKKRTNIASGKALLIVNYRYSYMKVL